MIPASLPSVTGTTFNCVWKKARVCSQIVRWIGAMKRGYRKSHPEVSSVMSAPLLNTTMFGFLPLLDSGWLPFWHPANR